MKGFNLSFQSSSSLVMLAAEEKGVLGPYLGVIAQLQG